MAAPGRKIRSSELDHEPEPRFASQASYHQQMHRAYRAVRARVAQRLSPCHPLYAEAVRDRFLEVVHVLQLEKPPEGRP